MSEHPIHRLYQQFMGAIPQGQASCYLCGTDCLEEHTVAKGLADTFNSHYLAACPSSPWLCVACQWYFDSKAGHPDFRKMSLIVGKSLSREWKREQMKIDIGNWLVFGLEQDAFLVCSLSKKKHILLQAEMTIATTKRLIIQVEERTVYLYPTEWKAMNEPFCQLLNLGHGKGEILSGNLYAGTLRKHGRIEAAMKISERLDPYRNSALLDLLSYVTIVEKGETDGTVETARNGSETTESGLHTDQPGLQEQVPRLDLGAGRKQRLSRESDHRQLDLFS